jgi:hypothetical protein
MEKVYPSKMTVTSYKNTRYHIPEQKNRIHSSHQLVTVVKRNIRCLFLESQEINKYTACKIMSYFIVKSDDTCSYC